MRLADPLAGQQATVLTIPVNCPTCGRLECAPGHDPVSVHTGVDPVGTRFSQRAIVGGVIEVAGR